MGLQLISWMSIILAAISFLAMVALIVHRWFQNWSKQKDEERSGILMNLALEYLEEPETLPAFKAQLKPNDRRLLLKLSGTLLSQVRGEYAQRVVELMRVLGVIGECLVRTRSPIWWIRREAVAVLGAFNEPRVIRALEEALNDPRIEIRIEAARSLIRLGAPVSVATLLTKLAVGKQMKSLTAKDIFRSLGPDAVPELIAVLEREDLNDNAKIFAVDALGHIGDLRAVPALLALSWYDAPEFRVAALQGLALLNDPRAVDVALEGLQDPAWEVRAQATICLGQLGAQEALLALEPLLNDEQWWVRYHAAEALLKFGESGVAVLFSAATGGKPQAAEMAYNILREKMLVA